MDLRRMLARATEVEEAVDGTGGWVLAAYGGLSVVIVKGQRAEERGGGLQRAAEGCRGVWKERLRGSEGQE